MKSIYLLVLAIISLQNETVSAQLTQRTATDTSLIGLRAVIIESSKTNTLTAPLYAETISKANVLNALDAVLKLRPAILNPESGTCASKDSLTLYVDGIRRLAAIPVLVPVITADSSNQSDLWATARKALDNNVMGNRPQRKTSTYDKQPRLEWIKAELSQIRAANVKSIHYVPCDGWSRDIGMRNVIWIELKE